MKKLKLSKVNFTGVEVLTREQLKNVMGGDEYNTSPVSGGCKESACTWTDEKGDTTSGTCGGKGDVSSAGLPYGSITMECFCNTPAHTSPSPVGSNGGVSRCYN